MRALCILVIICFCNLFTPLHCYSYVHFGCARSLGKKCCSIQLQVNLRRNADLGEIVRRVQDEQEWMSLARRSAFVEIPEISVANLVAEVEANGLARVNNVLSLDQVAILLSYINSELTKSLSLSEGDLNLKNELFSNVKSTENSGGRDTRWDLKLPFSEYINGILHTILGSGTIMGDTLQGLCAVGGGEIFELASFVTVNGADRQIMHTDTLWSRLPKLFTCMVALQDISKDMGPTVFIPGSHSEATHIRRGCFDGDRKVMESSPYVLSTLSAGDMVIYDSRLMHGGGANTSQKSRALFYFTVANLAAISRKTIDESMASIRREVKGKHTLKDFR